MSDTNPVSRSVSRERLAHVRWHWDAVVTRIGVAPLAALALLFGALLAQQGWLGPELAAARQRHSELERQLLSLPAAPVVANSAGAARVPRPFNTMLHDTFGVLQRHDLPPLEASYRVSAVTGKNGAAARLVIDLPLTGRYLDLREALQNFAARATDIRVDSLTLARPNPGEPRLGINLRLGLAGDARP